MKAWGKVLGFFTWCSLFTAIFLGSVLPVPAQQASVQRDGAVAAPLLATKNENRPNLIEIPDSPGATVVKAEDAANEQGAGQRWTIAALSPQTTQVQAAASQTQSAPQKPVGTAVAEAPDASGVAASQPAGVAIAPAKQRRTRTIMLRMGAIVGAGVAVGSVIALTAATPSKPPGAH